MIKKKQAFSFEYKRQIELMGAWELARQRQRELELKQFDKFIERLYIGNITRNG